MTSMRWQSFSLWVLMIPGLVMVSDIECVARKSLKSLNQMLSKWLSLSWVSWRIGKLTPALYWAQWSAIWKCKDNWVVWLQKCFTRCLSFARPCLWDRFLMSKPPYLLGPYTMPFAVLRLYPNFGKNNLVTWFVSLSNLEMGMEFAGKLYKTDGRKMEW